MRHLYMVQKSQNATLEHSILHHLNVKTISDKHHLKVKHFQWAKRNTHFLIFKKSFTFGIASTASLPSLSQYLPAKRQGDTDQQAPPLHETTGIYFFLEVKEWQKIHVY